ncbi:MAG: hypothetical protein RL695_1147 [Pseudomonadota bacterium]|jgi:hypothetical protein
MTNPTRQSSRQHTPGYKAVLVTDAAFSQLKSIQSWKSCERMPVRFDLKDIATAFVEEAMAIPGFQERVLKRALADVTALLITTKE